MLCHRCNVHTNRSRHQSASSDHLTSFKQALPCKRSIFMHVCACARPIIFTLVFALPQCETCRFQRHLFCSPSQPVFLSMSHHFWSGSSERFTGVCSSISTAIGTSMTTVDALRTFDSFTWYLVSCYAQSDWIVEAHRSVCRSLHTVSGPFRLLPDFSMSSATTWLPHRAQI